VLFNTPFLRAINLSIAVLLVAALGAAYWFAWRTLPETSGEIAAPIAARATVARDNLGVPHISAASWEDAIFLQGYVTAQDRMWQMDASGGWPRASWRESWVRMRWIRIANRGGCG